MFRPKRQLARWRCREGAGGRLCSTRAAGRAVDAPTARSCSRFQAAGLLTGPGWLQAGSGGGGGGAPQQSEEPQARQHFLLQPGGGACKAAKCSSACRACVSTSGAHAWNTGTCIEQPLTALATTSQGTRVASWHTSVAMTTEDSWKRTGPRKPQAALASATVHTLRAPKSCIGRMGRTHETTFWTIQGGHMCDRSCAPCPPVARSSSSTPTTSPS